MQTPARRLIQLEGKARVVFALSSVYPWDYLSEVQLNETYSEFRIGKHLSDTFPIQNGRLIAVLFPPVLLRICRKKGPGNSRRTEIKWDTSANDFTWYNMNATKKKAEIGANNKTCC
jgi:hypothetical protein